MESCHSLPSRCPVVGLSKSPSAILARKNFVVAPSPLLIKPKLTPSATMRRPCSVTPHLSAVWIFKEAKFTAAASTPRRAPQFEGLPDDDELDREAAALAARQD
jgi:hypothetical protein